MSGPSSAIEAGRLDPSRLDRADWIAAARTALIEGGVGRVKIVPLARLLGVTSGSFYWHFADRPALLRALLEDWEETNSKALVLAAQSGPDPFRCFQKMVETWVREDGFDPGWDSAVRDWARTSPEVEAVVERVDQARIGLLRGLFLAMGDAPEDAAIRARIAYYHQVGYYAMRIREPLEERLQLLPIYTALLTGTRRS